jgi:hypothetical protein
METEAIEGLQKFSEQSGLGILVEQWGYWFLIGLALLFVRESISNIISGAMIFFGSSYTNNECVYIHLDRRRPARITNCGLLSTTFFLYEIKDGDVKAGTLLKVSNTKLNDLYIERELDQLKV